MSTLERQVLDALPITVYTVDLEGRLTFLNRSWARFAQTNGAPQLCDENSVIGSSIWDSMTDKEVSSQIKNAMEMLRQGRATNVSWEFPCNSPTEERIFLLQLSLMGDTTVTGYAFSTVDITPSHRSREVLINTGMALARTISVERVFQEVSQQLRRSMSCDTVTIALMDEDSKDLNVVHHSGHDSADLAALQRQLAPIWNEVLAKGDVVTETQDTSVQITAPIAGGDTVLGAITITAVLLPAPHRLEELKRVLATIAAEAGAAIERAWMVRRLGYKRRLEAIGEVSAGVAHELRNPLFGISSATQLLRFRAKGDPVVEKNVDRIMREVERLNSMVTSLLEYGRPNPIHLEPGNPDDVWDEVLENQRARLESRSLHLHRTRAPERVASRIDARQLAQVFINVLVNAIDAAPECSELILHSSVAANGGWRCRLQNGGAPIPPEAVPKVFDIFFSLRAGGTGIGLALCQRIIEDHGGGIALESGAQGGTVLTISLPPA